jgi:hypothetical protein
MKKLRVIAAIVVCALPSRISAQGLGKRPIPWHDITAYGARAVASVPQTTGSCTKGSKTIYLNASPAFQNGDGLVMYGCGPTQTMITPTAPTVVTGQSQTLTIPSAVLTTITGSTAYVYRLVAKDKNGGLTVASPSTTITNGTATLGRQSYTIASESLTGSTLTVVTTAKNNLTANTLVHLSGSTNAALTGWFNISSITNGTTFVIKNLPIYSATAVTSTGGSLVYWIGNKLTWTYSANAWQYYICALRPQDNGAFHIIGLSYPYNTNANGNGSASLEYTDWGSVLSSAPTLSQNVSDSICTSRTPTNDYLSTTIISGGGTNSLVVAKAASQDAANKTVVFDNGPAILSAFAAAARTQNSVVLIPPDEGGCFTTSSFLNLPQGISLHQQGNLCAWETIVGTQKFQGDSLSGNGTPAFGTTSAATISCSYGAWPCLYIPPGSGQVYQYLQLAGSGNQSLLAMWDSGNEEGGSLSHMNFGTGQSPSDYSGTGLVVRGGRFSFKMQDLAFQPGYPGYTDQTWTPAMWVAHSFISIGAPLEYTLDDVTTSARSIYVSTYGYGLGLMSATNIYNQAAIMPTVTIQNLSGGYSAPLYFSRVHNDTSSAPILANLRSASGGIDLELAMDRVYGGGSEAGGLPPLITGVAPNGMTIQGSSLQTPTASPVNPIRYVNVHDESSYQYYANDFHDAGNRASLRSIAQFTKPISTLSSVFTPLATPLMSTPMVSAGGTDAVGTNQYCVVAVGWNGGWSAASCQKSTLSSGQQTVTLKWSAVTGAQGYTVIEGNKCIPVGNNDCTGISTTSTTLVYSGGSGCCFAVVPPTAAGDGINGFNANGLFGLQQTLFSGIFKSVESIPSLTANRVRKVPDMDGTYAFALTGTTGTITGTPLTNTCDSGTVRITGAVPGMPVHVSTTDGTDIGGAFNLRASVTSSNTVTVFVCGNGTPPSKAYSVRVIQ